MISADLLHTLVMSNAVIPVRFANSRFLLDGRGVLYWPAKDLLVFSDLHFEKGSFLTQFAHPLPRFDTRETLSRMADCIKTYVPAKVICLGDSFHDGNAGKRMEPADIDTINQMVASCKEWTWVLGNHDPDIPESMQGDREPYVQANELLFVHEPEDIAQFMGCEGQIIGHYHPKSSARIAQKKVTGKSFLLGDTKLLMPAFGKYTGGLSSDDPVMKSLFAEKKPQILLTYHKKLFML